MWQYIVIQVGRTLWEYRCSCEGELVLSLSDKIIGLTSKGTVYTMPIQTLLL